MSINRFSRHPVFTVVIVVMVGVLALVAIVESMPLPTGVLTNSRAIRLKEHPPNIHLKVSPSRRQLEESDGLRAITYEISTNENGYLFPPAPHDEPDLEVLFLGGSTTECLYMQPEDRFPAVAGRELERITGLKVNSYNAGVSGNNSMHSLLQLLAKGLGASVDIAILMNNINDLSTLMHFGSYWSESGPRSVIFDIPGVDGESYFSMLKKIVRKTAPKTYYLLHKYKSSVLHTQGRDEFESVRTKDIVIHKKRYLEEYEKSLRSFVALCRVWGIRPVFMTQVSRLPTYQKDRVLFEKLNGISFDEYVKLWMEFNDIVRFVALQENVFLIDLDKRIAHDADTLYDAIHFTASGSRRVGEFIARELADKPGYIH